MFPVNDPVFSFNLPPDNRTDDCPRCGHTIFLAEGGFCENCAESDMEAEGQAAWEEMHRNDSIIFQVVPARAGDPVDMG